MWRSHCCFGRGNVLRLLQINFGACRPVWAPWRSFRLVFPSGNFCSGRYWDELGSFLSPGRSLGTGQKVIDHLFDVGTQPRRLLPALSSSPERRSISAQLLEFQFSAFSPLFRRWRGVVCDNVFCNFPKSRRPGIIRRCGLCVFGGLHRDGFGKKTNARHFNIPPPGYPACG